MGTTFVKADGTTILGTSTIDTRKADVCLWNGAYFALVSRDPSGNATFKAANVVSVNSAAPTITFPM